MMAVDNSAPFEKDTLQQQSNDLIDQLANLEGGLHALLEKVKGDSQIAKDISTFLKKRAFLEESYGKDMVKVAQTTAEAFEKAHPVSGTFGDVWLSMLNVHKNIGNQRIKFAASISDAAEDLASLGRNIEKDRKKIKNVGMHYEKEVTDSDLALEKTHQKLNQANDQWSRAVSQMNHEPVQSSKKSRFASSKTFSELKKDETKYKVKIHEVNAEYEHQMNTTNDKREEYYRSRLPSVLKDLKAVDDECNIALRYQLASYSYTFEQALTEDGLALDNEQGDGLRGLITKIDKDADWADFVRFRADQSSKIRTNVAINSSNITAATAVYGNAVFGASLEEQAQLSEDMVPDILKRCATVIEEHGLHSNGIYRRPGSASKIKNLKARFNSGDPNPITEDDLADINVVESVLKDWFRELPDRLFPAISYNEFLIAAQKADSVIALHELINALPDANYATLKYFMKHLHTVQSSQRFNKMGIKNLALIFGVTLMGRSQNEEVDKTDIIEIDLQTKVVEIILENYSTIFEE